MGRVFAVYCTLFNLFGSWMLGYGFPQPQESATLPNGTKLEPTVSESISSSIAVKHEYDDSDMYLEPNEEYDNLPYASQTENMFQNLYPPYSLYNNPPLGHSRPFIYQQEAAFSQRPAAYRQQLNYDNIKYNNPFRRENYQVPDNNQNLLGSGNFGVIRGGTFYNEVDGESSDYNKGRYNNFSPFFHNNGHGRPAFFFGATNPKPQQHEQFANFRDFADINTPNTAYSQYVVVYVNKNGSSLENVQKKIAQPKNINERLAMLDLEAKKNKDSLKKKLSASKKKLALLLPEKKVRGKKITTTTPSMDLYEPLLALS